MRQLSTLLIFFLSISIFAQKIDSEQIVFEGEGSKDRYSITWTMKKDWPKSLDGFIVKKRSKSGSWEAIGKNEGFVPQINAEPEYSNMILGDVQAQQELKTFFDKQRAKNKIKLKTAEEYKKILTIDESPMVFLNFAFKQEFNLALLSGFGLIDADFAKKSGEYEYGLFPIINGKPQKKPVKTLFWKYGSTPVFEIDTEHNFETTAQLEKLKVDFKISESELEPYQQISNYNIRKNSSSEDKLLVDHRLPSEQGNMKVVSTTDREVDKENITTYVLEANTIFKNTFPIGEFKFDPNKDVPKAGYSLSASITKDEENFPIIKWKANKIDPKFINHFIIQRDNGGFQFETIKEVGQDQDNYTDKSLTSQQEYRYRVIMRLKNDFEQAGTKPMNFYYVKPVVAPTNLKGKYVKLDGHKYVQLTWEIATPKAVDEYYVYSLYEGYTEFYQESSLPRIYTPKVLIPINNYTAKKYIYRVTASNNVGKESEPSNEFVFISPSDEMRTPYIKQWDAVDKKIKITWKDDPYKDIDHYEIFFNDEKVGEVSPDNRTWTSEEVPAGSYMIGVQSVSQTDVRSDMSPLKKLWVK